jgi:hypothetical protein
MIDRQQINLRLERELVDSLDDLARKDHVDRTEIARRILVDGIAKARMDRALVDYRAERVTAWKAAEDGGVSLYEMLDRIHEAHIPHPMDPEELAAIDAYVAGRQRRAAEETAQYGTDTAQPEGDVGFDAGYRPDAVNILFVGIGSPADGPQFYRANSKLFRATRTAFARAFVEDAVPDGEAFLRYFRDHGCWIVDLGSPAALAEIIRDAEPAHVVTVKRDIADSVAEAIAIAESAADLTALPFPVRQWTKQYEAELARFLGELGD